MITTAIPSRMGVQQQGIAAPISPIRLEPLRIVLMIGWGFPPDGTEMASKSQSGQEGRCSVRQSLYRLRSSSKGLGPPFASMSEMYSQGRDGSLEEGSLPNGVANGG